jgi:phosphoribosylformylglycinamidine (FGAM) synthase-like enzyme
MEDVIIPPASVATTGLITGSRHNHGDHNNHGNHDRDWPERTTERIKDQLADFERAVTATVVRSELATEKTGAAGVLATSVAAGALGVSVEKTSAANQLTTNVAAQQIQNTLLSNFNGASVQAQTFNAATQLAFATNTAAIQLEAAKNAAANLAALAECCCEIKARILENGEKTRDLINGNQSLNLAVQLADAKNEVLALRLRTPLAA